MVMQIATIVPTKYLYMVEADDYHLCLAQLIETDPSYTSFYKAKADTGSFVILDNGAAEGHLPETSYLYEKALKINANEVQVPDVFFQKDETLKLAFKGVNFLKKKKWPGTIMVVPQGRYLHEWVDCAKEMCGWDSDICIGVPKNLVHTIGHRGRLEALQELFLQMTYLKPIHLLGCWTDPREVGEIYKWFQEQTIGNCLRGVDSRLAYLYAYEGWELDPDMHDKPPRKDIDFSDSSTNEELLEHNIKLWREYCYGERV